MSPGRPHMWTGITTRVRGPIAASSAAGDSVIDSSMSTITGIAPTPRAATAVAMKVCAGTITSSPGPTPRPASAATRAVVPLEVSITCRTPRCSAQRSSNRPHAEPARYRKGKPEARTSAMLSTSSRPTSSMRGFLSGTGFYSMGRLVTERVALPTATRRPATVRTSASATAMRLPVRTTRPVGHEVLADHRFQQAHVELDGGDPRRVVHRGGAPGGGVDQGGEDAAVDPAHRRAPTAAGAAG